MGFTEVQMGEIYGIRYKGKDYVVNPSVKKLKEAQRIFKDKKKSQDLEELLNAINLIIPNFPIDEVSVTEVVPIIKGITNALKENLKNVSSPEE